MLGKGLGEGEPALTRFPLFAKRSVGSFDKLDPFEKGYTKRHYSSTLTASPRWNEYSTASVTGSPSCRRTIAAYSFSCKA